MIVIIPLGGTGERFKKNNYHEPKALIKVLGKPIIFYLLENLNLDNIDFVYIPYNKEYCEYRFEDLLRKYFPNIKFKFLILENNTEGALHTISLALDNLSILDTPIISLDGDNFYNIDIIKKWNGKNKVFVSKDIMTNDPILINENELAIDALKLMENNRKKSIGVLPVFNDNSNEKLPIYSYVKVNDTYVVDIREKEVISDYACTGCYAFESYKTLLGFSKKILNEKTKQKNEYYISGVIKEMISNNINFNIEIINKNNWICLGTPIQIRMFCNNYPKISCDNNKTKIKNMRICFDLDNTLVTYSEIPNDYTSVKPIQNNIDN